MRLQFQRETGAANMTDRRARIQNADFNDDALFDQAFVQFARLTAGVTDSFWDFKPYTTFQNPFISDRIIGLLAYTFRFGDMSASISLEDMTTRYVSTASSLQNEGQQIPDIVVNLRVKQGWGEARSRASRIASTRATQAVAARISPAPMASGVGASRPV